MSDAEPSRGDEPGYVTDTDPLDRPHKKSRLIGGLLLFLGVLMTVVVFSGQLERESSRVKALVTFLASGGSWVGIGLLLFPWTHRMVAGFTTENNAAIGFQKLPVLWKAWLALALVVTVAAVAAVISVQK